MAAGGFLLSNYQPELAELFRDGEEVVMYTSMDDLKEKAGYYLERRISNPPLQVCRALSGGKGDAYVSGS
jgi:hypothetical protein